MLKVLATLLAVAIWPTSARADFLDDLFGNSEPGVRTVHAGPALRRQVEVRPHRAKVKPMTTARVDSDVRFMPVSHPRAKERAVTVQARPTHDAAAAGKPATVALCASSDAVAGAAPASLLAVDKTLRKGDILVTDAGVRVFRGDAACPHDARDFVAVSVVHMARSRRNMLLALEDAMRRSSADPQTAKMARR
jgi:hypothetical protein